MKFAGLFEEKGLSLDRLRMLAAVDEADSIAAVAPDDESRQSLISRQLAELERFFHAELKEKKGRTLRLTPAGKELARLAREHLQALECFHRNCTNRSSEIVIGAGDSLLQWLVLPRIKSINAMLPDSVIELQDLQNLAVSQRLHERVIDFGLLRSDLVARGALTGRSLGTFGYSLFIPDKLWPGGKPGEAELIQQFPLVIQGGNTLFQSRLGELAMKNRWKLKVRLLCESFPQAAQALASGQMAAILPDFARLPAGADSVRICPLKSLDGLRREIFLAWHARQSETRPHLAGIPDKLVEALKLGK